MGEIADMMINGVLCSQCGCALYKDVMEQDLGFPVMCADCYADLPEKEKEFHTCETTFHNLEKA